MGAASTTLRIVDPAALSTVLFDLGDPTGAANAAYGSVKTDFAVGEGGPFGLGAPPLELVQFAPPEAPGATTPFAQERLVKSTWRQRLFAADVDSLRLGIGGLSRLLRAGGVLAWQPKGSNEVRYADFEPSPAPALLDGRPYDLHKAVNLLDTLDGVELELWRQPFLRGPLLSSATNRLTNATLLDVGATAGRPDGWTWISAAGISNELIATDGDGSYQFDVAFAGSRNLVQVTAAATAAPGDVWTLSFYARVAAVAGTPRALIAIEYLSSGGGILRTDNPSPITLTTSWQRITMTGAAAPASTDHLRLNAMAADVDATSVTMQFKQAQLEKAPAASKFVVGTEIVKYDPEGTSGLHRILPLYLWGDAPAPVNLAITADANGFAEVGVARLSGAAGLSFINVAAHKQLESGTLGANTTSVADGTASSGNVAQVAYPTPAAPAFRAEAHAEQHSAESVITINKPAGTVAGDILVAKIHRWSGSNVLSGAPAGWILVEQFLGDYVYLKLAGASEPASYSWTKSDTAGAMAGSIVAVSGGDPVNPIDSFLSMIVSGTPTASLLHSGLTTGKVSCRLLFWAIASSNDVTTAMTFTPPAGETERADWNGINGQVYAGQEAADEAFTGPGATGTRTATAVVSAGIARVTLVAVAPAGSTEAVRSTVAWTAGLAGLRGPFDVYLRVKPSVASKHRLRLEWAPSSAPAATDWITAPVVTLDTTLAASQDWQDVKVGRIFVPPTVAISGISLRLYTQYLGQATGVLLNLDFLCLVPTAERVGAVQAPRLLTTSQVLKTLAEQGQGQFYDAAGNLLTQGVVVVGPTPVLGAPGTNILQLVPLADRPVGFQAARSILAAGVTVAHEYYPRYFV
jgi:hypothetical protein